MAVAGTVKLQVIASAQENIRAVLKQSNAAIKQSASELRKAGIAQTKMGAAVGKAIRGQGKFRAAMISSADRVSKFGSKVMNLKAALGAMAAAMAIRQLKDFTIAGEKAANIAQRFAASTQGSAAALVDMQRATAGLVEATDLQIIANRFARLGVPIRDVTRLLELATKAAIDQGREVIDVARVIEASLKGRTTGLIDIGVNIDKITGLTKKYAKATGVAVEELDEMDRRLKVALPAALQALGEQFDDVDVEDFTLRMQQANTAFGDLVSDWQVGAAQIFEATAEAFEPAEDTLGTLVDTFGRLSKRQAATSEWFKKNKDSALLMLMATGDLDKRTRALDGSMRALRGRLREMPLKERAEAFDALQGKLALMTGEARTQITTLFHLEAKWAGVAAAANAASVSVGLFSMGPGVSQMSNDIDKAGAAYDLIAQAAKDRRTAERAAAKEAAVRLRARVRDEAAANALRATEGIKRQEAANAVASIEGARFKLLFEALEKERLIKAEVLGIDDESLRIQFEKAHMAGLDLEVAETLREINKQELEIDERRLQSAKDKAEQTALESDERRELIAGMIGDDLADVAGLFAEMDANLERLGRPARYAQIAKGFSALAAQSNQIAKGVADFANAVAGSDKSMAEGAAAALGAIQPAVVAFMNGQMERALVMMGFELAMMAAYIAEYNWPQAAAHGVAATMFGVVAGVAASQPTRAGAPEVAGGSGGLITPSGPDPSEQEAQKITVNLGPGTIFGMPQEMGRAIADRISSMAGSGMEATAF